MRVLGELGLRHASATIVGNDKVKAVSDGVMYGYDDKRLYYPMQGSVGQLNLQLSVSKIVICFCFLINVIKSNLFIYI